MPKKEKVESRCQFCNSVIDPTDPFYEHAALKLDRTELEEIRRYLAYHLNKDGMFNSNDNPRGLVKPEILADAYSKLTGFLMK